MIANFKRGGYVEEKSYNLCFFYDRNGGYAFPCDQNGTLFWDEMWESAKKNYAWCMEHPEEFPYCFNKVQEEIRTYREPNTGTCRCGEEIELTNDYYGACQCPNCGQWYNMCGDELLPPDKWGWDGTDW